MCIFVGIRPFRRSVDLGSVKPTNRAQRQAVLRGQR